MSGLTSPAASTIALPVALAPPSVNAPGVPGLAAFVDLMIGKIAAPAARLATGGDERQDDAASGKDLPEKDKNLDPALAWLFGAAPIALPVPAPLAPTSAPPVIDATFGPVDPDILIASGGTPAKPVAIETPVAKPADEPIAAPQPVKLPLLQPRQPFDRSPTQPPVVAALPALLALSMTPERSARDDDPISPLTPATTPSLQPATTIPVGPAGDARRQALDLGRQDWPQKMIDRIEALRDNANANDTSIRLKPEALGRVDVSVKTEADGAISVRFAAEQPTTRSLLIDAAPQLTAAAEARGIRLSGTSVDLSGQGDPRPQPHTERAQPISNRLAATRGADDNQAVDDGRIA